jgi:hypothetical protein
MQSMRLNLAVAAGALALIAGVANVGEAQSHPAAACSLTHGHMTVADAQAVVVKTGGGPSRPPRQR